MNRRAFLQAGHRRGRCRIRTDRLRPEDGADAYAGRRPLDSGRLQHLVPVRASWDRVIRTTVGLRPHRDPGFVLKADQASNDKLLVHNYGHGGAGMSLAWGTGLMAAEFATEHQARRRCRDRLRFGRADQCAAAAAARLRRDDLRGGRTAIRHVEHVAGWLHAGIGLVATDRRTPEWDAQYRSAVEIAYRQLQLMTGAGYGVTWIDNFNLANELRTPSPPDPSRPAPLPQLLPDEVVLQPGEHPVSDEICAVEPEPPHRAVTSTSTRWSRDFPACGAGKS